MDEVRGGIPWMRSVRSHIDILFGLLALIVLSFSLEQYSRSRDVSSTVTSIRDTVFPATRAASEMNLALQAVEGDLLRHALGDRVATMGYFSNIEKFRESQSELKSLGVLEEELSVIVRAMDNFRRFAVNQIIKPHNENDSVRLRVNLDRLNHSLYEPLIEVVRQQRGLTNGFNHSEHRLWDELNDQLHQMRDATNDYVQGKEGVESLFVEAMSKARAVLTELGEGQENSLHGSAGIMVKDLFRRYRRAADFVFKADVNSIIAAREAAVNHVSPLASGVRNLINELSVHELEQMNRSIELLNSDMHSVRRDSLIATFAVLALLLGGRYALGKLVVKPFTEASEMINSLRIGRRNLIVNNQAIVEEHARTFTNIGLLQSTLVELEEEQRERLRSAKESHLNELQKAFDELSQSEADLRRESEIVQSKNSELEQFVHIASHDLREPLKKLYSYCEILIMSFGNDITDEQTNYASRILANAKKLIRLIDDLRSLTAVSQDKLEKRPCDLQNILYEVLSSRAEEIDKSGHLITIDKLPRITGYPELLHQVFANLIDNALRYSSEGGGISISLIESSDLKVSLSFSNQRPVRTFTQDQYIDNKKSSSRLLLPFVRGQSEGDGTGMGLAICKKIVERHGGSIWILSDKPNEFSVCVSFPTIVTTREVDQCTT